jgi:serine/threonine protein phosphatase PrpC
MKLDENDRFLIVASDGLWENVSETQVSVVELSLTRTAKPRCSRLHTHGHQSACNHGRSEITLLSFCLHKWWSVGRRG